MVQSESKKKILELLAPAGNMSQAIQSIKAGCDAIYGGLSNWNARMRAGNFSLDEYKHLMEICRKHDVKFYMTLNTLFKDAELDSVLKILSDVDFILPDAVIVADIGLMSLLSKNFPQIDLHASTQYGAYTIDDIKFLERYNITRVILARELTLQEIKKIRDATNIELEIFCYGSQCVCFSGQCLWSGLTQECSGNRGRCLAPCRDFYRQNHLTGQFLYPQDIDACAIIKKIVAAGVDSLKIEGRFRDGATTALAVKHFRNAIDNWTTEPAAELTESYLGYLGNKVPVKSMFHVINPRVPLHKNAADSFGAHDFVAEINKNGDVAIKFGEKIADPENFFYLKTIFHEKLNSDNDAAWAMLYFEDGFLTKFEIFDNLGRQFTYTLPRQNIIETTPKDIVTVLKNSLSFRLREIFSNVPEFSSVQINQADFTTVLREINNICNVTPKPPLNHFVAPSKEDYIRLNSLAVMQQLKEFGYKNFIFDITSAAALEKVLAEDSTDSIIYRLPLLDFTDSHEKILPALHNKFVMITRPMHLLYKEKYVFKKIFADYTLNVWNSATLAVLKNFDVEMFVAHPELALAESENFAQNANISVGVVYAGKIPLGYTRACFQEMNLCDGNCCNSTFELENVTKSYKLQILCNADLGYRTIFSSTMNIAGTDTRSCKKIYNFSQLTFDEIQSLLTAKLNDFSKIGMIYGRSVL